MIVHGLLAKVGATVVTGTVGAAAYDVVRKLASAAPVHEAAVIGAEWGLRSVRKAEDGAESARLKVADVVAEARERIGEQAPPPTPIDARADHEH
jgi:hypothetical protein